MDVLYILGTGSPFDNEELKYSLRSLERFGKNIDRLILVGEKPDFLDYSKVIHLPYNEVGQKDYRIAMRIHEAFRTGTVTGDVLFCNDDFFFMKPFDANIYPYFQRGDLLNGPPRTPYQNLLKRTKDLLISEGKTTFHFDVHTPIIYNAEKFMALESIWQSGNNPEIEGYVVKSVYCNMYGIQGIEYNDVKIRSLNDFPSQKLVFNSHVFSIYNDAWNTGVKRFLYENFKTKSKWEK